MEWECGGDWPLAEGLLEWDVTNELCVSPGAAAAGAVGGACVAVTRIPLRAIGGTAGAAGRGARAGLMGASAAVAGAGRWAGRAVLGRRLSGHGADSARRGGGGAGGEDFETTLWRRLHAAERCGFVGPRNLKPDPKG